MPFAKGHAKVGGRAPGRVNGVTRDLREAILHAFDKVGGQEYLVKVARKNPQIFCMLLAKVLPLQVAGVPGAPIEVKVTHTELARRIAFILAQAAHEQEKKDEITWQRQLEHPSTVIEQD